MSWEFWRVSDDQSDLSRGRRNLLIATILAGAAVAGVFAGLATGGNWVISVPYSQDVTTGSNAPVGANAGRLTADQRRVLKRAASDKARRSARFKSASAKSERKASRTKFRTLSPRRARRAVAAEQPGSLENPAWSPPELEDGERIVSYSSPTTALIDMPDSEAGAIVESTAGPIALPEDDGFEAISLELEQEGASYSPRKAMIESQFPFSLETPITMPVGGSTGDVQIRPASTSAPGVLVESKKLFYANALDDTDVIAEALPSGAAVAWTLRSPASPESLPLDFSAGGDLEFELRQDGSAAVKTDGSDIGIVQAPAAWDAQGQIVDARYRVTGSGLAVNIAHRGKDLAYPIVVDPYVNWFGWASFRDDIGVNEYGDPLMVTGSAYWGQYTNNPTNLFFQDVLEGSGIRMNIKSRIGARCCGWVAHRDYSAPNNSTVFRAHVPMVRHSPAQYTAITVGIINGGGDWETGWGAWTDGATCVEVSWGNVPGCQGGGPLGNATGMAQADVHVCAAAGCGMAGSGNNGVRFRMDQNVPSGGATTVAPESSFRGVYAYFSDYSNPSISVTGGPSSSAWQSSPQLNLSAHIDDFGGVGLGSQSGPSFGYNHSFNAFEVRRDGSLLHAEGPDCWGGSYQPCPTVIDQPYADASPAEGLRTYEFKATDIVGHTTVENRTWRIDNTPPEITLRGRIGALLKENLADGEQPRVITRTTPVKIDASDGSTNTDANRRSGVKQLRMWVTGSDANGNDNGIQVGGAIEDNTTCDGTLQNGVQATDSCESTVEGVIDPQEFSPGVYFGHVNAVDQLGNVSAKTYKFGIGIGDIVSVSEGLATARHVPLQADLRTGETSTGAKFQWRPGTSGGWLDVPVAATRYENDGNPPADNVFALDNDGKTVRVVVDIDSLTLPAGGPPKDGEISFRALFQGTDPEVARSSEDISIVLDRGGAKTGDDTAQVGPGTLDLLTGNLAMSATDFKQDAYLADLSVSRSYNSRYTSVNDGAGVPRPVSPLGPGWEVNLPAGSSPYTGVTDHGDSKLTDIDQSPFVELHIEGGGMISFELLPADPDDPSAPDKYQPEAGYEYLRLDRIADSDGDTVKFKLTDLESGVITWFAERDLATNDGTFKTTSVENPGSTREITYEYQPVQTRQGTKHWPKRAVAPIAENAPAGTFECGGSASVQRGCQWLAFTYEDVLADPEDPDDPELTDKRLTRVTLHAWNPATNSMSDVDVVRYEYDTSGRLARAWDPRISPALKTTYSYDANNLITTITPPGEEPHSIAYASATGDATPGRVASVSRSALASGVATTHVRYGVPLSSENAPHNMSVAELSRWGQAVPPLTGTALFPPDHPPSGANPDNFGQASISYLDAMGREVNSLAPGDRLSTTEYDLRGNVVRTLTPANRVLALTKVEQPVDLDSQTASKRYDTQTRYVESTPLAGVTTWRAVESKGPMHPIRVPGQDDPAEARTVTRTTYDEGAPTGGTGPSAPTGPYDLPTTTTVGAELQPVDPQVEESPLVDVRVSRTQYDWQLRQPVAQITDMGTSDPGDDIVRRFVLDPVTGQELERRQPETSESSSAASTTKTLYYKAGAHAEDSDCGDKPEWIGLVCKVRSGDGPTGSELADLPEKHVKSYNMVRQPLETFERVTHGSTTSTRTTNATYDAAGRPLTEEMTATTDDPDTSIHPLPKTKHVYSTSSGREIRTETLNSDGSVAKSISRTYDTLGRPTNYVDANGNASSTSYDLLSRPVQTSDGKGTQTRGYDSLTGELTALLDSQIGATSASYDTDGRVVTETLPNGLVKTNAYDAAGAVVGITYFKSTDCPADCLWYSDNVERSAHGQVMTDSDTFTQREYEYDHAGRLTRATGVRNGTCTTRSYQLNKNSNRLSQRRSVSENADCDLSGGTTTDHTYDNADRLTDPGYEYDSFGRITRVPEQDAGGQGDLSATYYVNDLARSIEQGSTTQTLSLDPAQRAFSRTIVDDGPLKTESYAYDSDTDSPSWVASEKRGVTQSSEPINIAGTGDGASQVVSGTEHSCALIEGAVWCWGANRFGQLGDGTTTDREQAVQVEGLTSGVAEIAAGNFHTCARTDAGAIKCWGHNGYGRLGYGTDTYSSTPATAAGMTTGVSDIAAGAGHTCAVVDGSAKCWGLNGYGQLGNNRWASSRAPVQVLGLTSGVQSVDAAGTATCALTDQGAAKCWGYSGNNFSRYPVDVQGLGSGVAQIDMGTQHTCALTTQGAMKCWGSNGAGQLGDGTTVVRKTPVDVVGLGSGVTAISAGNTHTCAIKDNTAMCFGHNTDGQLGDGTTTNRSTPVPVAGTGPNPAAITAGNADTCVAVTSKAVQCLGLNDTYQLGPMQSTQTWTRYIAAIGGGLAATRSSTGQTRYQLANIRGDVVAEANDSGLQQTAPVDEFGVPEDGQLPTGTRYAFQGTHQREALTPGGTIAMGVRLYVPRIGRFLQVDPVLGGTDNAYEYPSDPVNERDLDGEAKQSNVRARMWLTRRKALRMVNRARKALKKAEAMVWAGSTLMGIGTGWFGAVAGPITGLAAQQAINKMRDNLDRIVDYLAKHPRSYGVYIVETGNSTNTAPGAPSGVYIHSWNPKACSNLGGVKTCTPVRAPSHVERYW